MPIIYYFLILKYIYYINLYIFGTVLFINISNLNIQPLTNFYYTTIMLFRGVELLMMLEVLASLLIINMISITISLVMVILTLLFIALYQFICCLVLVFIFHFVNKFLCLNFLLYYLSCCRLSFEYLAVFSFMPLSSFYFSVRVTTIHHFLIHIVFILAFLLLALLKIITLQLFP